MEHKKVGQCTKITCQVFSLWKGKELKSPLVNGFIKISKTDQGRFKKDVNVGPVTFKLKLDELDSKEETLNLADH